MKAHNGGDGCQENSLIQSVVCIRLRLGTVGQVPDPGGARHGHSRRTTPKTDSREQTLGYSGAGEEG